MFKVEKRSLKSNKGKLRCVVWGLFDNYETHLGQACKGVKETQNNQCKLE